MMISISLFVTHFFRTEAISNDIDGESVTSFDDPNEAFEFIVRENAYPPRTHFHAGDGGELTRVPFHVVSGIPASMSQYTSGWCT